MKRFFSVLLCICATFLTVLPMPIFAQPGLTWTRMSSAEALGISFIFKASPSVLLGINSTLASVTSPAIDKLYRSVDNGITWTLFSPNENFSGFARANGRLYAITNPTPNNTRLITSTNDGATWSQLSVLPSNNYAPGVYSKIIVNGSTILIVQMATEKVLISQNGGVTFTETATNLPKSSASGLAFFDCILTKNGSYLLSLSETSSTPANSTTATLWRSTSGTTWQPVTTTLSAYKGADELHQLPNGDIYGAFTRTGTTYALDWLKSTDAGLTWTSIPYPPGGANPVLGRSGFTLGNTLFTINAGTTSTFSGSSWQSATTLMSATPLPRFVATKVKGLVSPMSDIPNEEVFVSEETIGGRAIWRSTAGLAPPPVPIITDICSEDSRFCGTPQNVGEGFVFTIFGTGFTNVSAVRVGTVNATSFTVLNSVSMTAVVPNISTTGTYSVSVVTPGGIAVSSKQLSFFTAPVILDILPERPVFGSSPQNVQNVGEGSVFTILGAGFTNVSAVRIGTVNATSFTVLNANSITAVVPNLPTAGTYNVSVVMPSGTVVSSQQLSFVTTPLIIGTPQFAAVRGTRVTIFGANFRNVNSVKFGSASSPDLTPATSFTIENVSTISAIMPDLGTNNLALFALVESPQGSTRSTTQLSYVGMPNSFLGFFGFMPSVARVGEQVVVSGINLMLIERINIVIGTGPTAEGINVPIFSVSNDGLTLSFTVPQGARSGGIVLYYGAGTSTASIGRLTILNPTSVRREVEKLGGSVYPNPATQNLTVTTNLSRTQGLVLALRDILGRTLLQQTHTAISGHFSTNVDVSELASGLYIVSLTGQDGKQFVQPFVKQ